MKVIWQCKNCEGGPCYVCAPNQVTQGSMYDTGGAYPPPICPYSPHFERAEFEEVPTYSIAHSPFDSLTEWLNTDEVRRRIEEMKNGGQKTNEEPQTEGDENVTTE